jgi:hypothetical protein
LLCAIPSRSPFSWSITGGVRGIFRRMPGDRPVPLPRPAAYLARHSLHRLRRQLLGKRRRTPEEIASRVSGWRETSRSRRASRMSPC